MLSQRLATHQNILGCASEDDFFAYRAQRWMWNEPLQLQRRYVGFNLNGLIQVAVQAAGGNVTCTNITKLPEGNFNKVFMMTMSNGQQLIVKIPNPNAGRKHYTTASEVATMNYLSYKVEIPVPKVLEYCSRIDESAIDAEYIVLEKAPGVELSHVWDNLSPRDKSTLVKQLGEITGRLSKATFPCYGSLYHLKDLPESEARQIDDTYAIGPTTARAWFDDRRDEDHVCLAQFSPMMVLDDMEQFLFSQVNAPGRCPSKLMKALVQRETACINNFISSPNHCQQGIFNGPGGYCPTRESKLAVLRDFEKICQFILPNHKSLNAGILWHNDLHSNNIFVEANDPKRISCIIDWQATPVYPMFLVASHPALLEFDGPRLEGFTQPQLPENVKQLSPHSKKAAKNLFLAQSLWLLYEVQLQRQAPDLLHAIRYTDTHQSQLLGAIATVFDDGEPYVQSLITDIITDKVWARIVGSDESGKPLVPCPVRYSEGELQQQKEEFAKWERDIDLKQQVLKEVGAYTGWDGAVSPREYDEIRRRLQSVKARFLDRQAKTAEERKAWESVWQFQDNMI
ncbi:hypothetical protein PRK78_002409 [Emydomyces testavorans]|uniref:Altered inheritance of mitochondria protein 9, mitochondrial n=1 Tax=Emydomyces testavorans TaxID=2070801 RepID=A0AAF0IGF6_9EURO|nr:hypothetical protein PRK78_002409 [Emydomyces testavorans]